MKINGGSIKWNGDKFMLLATNETIDALTKAAIYTQGVAKKMVGGAGSGRVYKRKGVIHRASKPGKPPARDYGALAASISYTVRKRLLKVQAFVGSDIDIVDKKVRERGSTTDVQYGYYLEKGTGRMAARPWLKPSLIKARPKILRILKAALR